ncbi:putative fatty acyl-CoA reductase CG5065 [Zerene cesonia]|uniref:putative fatty acyl-CoA reductase CG5065 n=1 Tax=Zerene cesonia TaxID=33412 RepID=UPI0018E5A1FC|nr:putative fatty acyl-CoA reductase CG5065 [Zerene cesonia]
MASVRVAEYYAGKALFVTGGTGFMGKVLVEKLLRCCPDIKVIYLLLRPKKGLGVKSRLQEYINGKVFDKLREVSPEAFDKLRPVAGDIESEGLGISPQDRNELLAECQIVFHVAASVRFDTFIRDAVNMNIAGTERTLQLAEGMKKLEVFLHTSTSYCRSDIEILEEKLYPAKHDPFKLMDCMKWMDDDLLTHMQPALIHPEPNTYGYTKCLTEQLVASYNGKFPIVLARPSIVTASIKEPIPGWIDNLNGPTGIIVGAGKGVIRTMYCDITRLADTVPVDVTINACILLAYLNGMKRQKDIVVCNITRSECDPLTWGEAMEYGRNIVHDYPFSVMLWYPGGSPTDSKLLFKIQSIYAHFLPALFIDLLLRLLGHKPFLVKLQKKIEYGMDVLEHYANRSWCFKNGYFLSLKNSISKEDDKIFFTDISNMNWPNYLKNYILGAREQCCKDDLSTLPRARRLHTQ